MSSSLYPMPGEYDYSTIKIDYPEVPKGNCTSDKKGEKSCLIQLSYSSVKEKIYQFKQGKYTEKYIKTYVDFVLMEGVINNLQYLEFLKELVEKV